MDEIVENELTGVRLVKLGLLTTAGKPRSQSDSVRVLVGGSSTAT